MQEKVFQKRQQPESFKRSAIPVKLKLVYLQCNILIVMAAVMVVVMVVVMAAVMVVVMAAVQYHFCKIFFCLT